VLISLASGISIYVSSEETSEELSFSVSFAQFIASYKLLYTSFILAGPSHTSSFPKCENSSKN